MILLPCFGQKNQMKILILSQISVSLPKKE